jgi:HAD superfamily hydrolase (TIGR01509 family)
LSKNGRTFESSKDYSYGVLFPRIEAIFSDLDGTLVDSEEALVHGWTDTIGAYGHDFSKFDYLTIIGTPEEEKVELVLGFFGIEEDAQVFYARLQERFRCLMPDEIKLMPGVLEFLERCKATGAPRGLVTSATKWHADLALDALGLRPYFHPTCLITAETEGLEHRKPYPDPYLLAAQRFHIKSFRCVAFEDSPHGAASARAAGMLVVGVPHGLSPRGNLEGIANYILPEGETLDDFKFEDICHLLPQ